MPSLDPLITPAPPVVMADRKRPAVDDSHSVASPPLKRQAVSVNGGTPQPVDDMPGRDDLDRYQKDAILRQMREYKREAQVLEDECKDAVKRATTHELRLRKLMPFTTFLVECFARQLGKQPPALSQLQDSFFAGPVDELERALADRQQEVLQAVKILSDNPAADHAALQQQYEQLSLDVQGHVAKIAVLESEHERLQDVLESASLRYMLAEKKLDRARSAQVARVEAQAIATIKPEPQAVDPQQDKQIKSEVSSIASEEMAAALKKAEAARNEAVALADKRAEQLDQLVQDNKKLIGSLTNAQAKAHSLADEDFSKSEMFKLIKSTVAASVTRYDEIEGTNQKLVAENKRLLSERIAFKEEVDNESRMTTIESESTLQRTESDLVRVRHARDELIADLQKAKAQLDLQVVSQKQAKELAESYTARIKVLEDDVARLSSAAAAETPAATGLSQEELEAKVQALERDKGILEGELASMAGAWRKATSAGHQRHLTLLDAEERCARLTAEKSKADQKYFGAMKAKEAREGEVRALKAMVDKSTEVINTLKETEASCRSTISAQERRLASLKQQHQQVTSEKGALQKVRDEKTFEASQLSGLLADTKQSLVTKDAAYSTAAEAQRQAETKLAALEARYEESQRTVDGWRKKAAGNDSEEVEMLRNLALCTVCRHNFKNTAIKTCGHVFCHECVESRVKERSRKCPNCGKPFGSNDYMHVTL